MWKFLKDRRGGPLEKVIIWAFLLGGFYFAWTKYIGPSFMGSAEKQSDVLKDSTDTYMGGSIPE